MPGVSMTVTKVLELVIACACAVFHYYTYNLGTTIGMVATGTFVGYTVLSAGVVIGLVMQAEIDKRISIFYSIVGVILFVASGALILDRYMNFFVSDIRNKNIIKASLAIANGALYLIDAILTARE